MLLPGKTRRALLALLLPTILAACDPSDKPTLSLPTVCDRFKKTVPDPIDAGAVKIADDAIATVALYRQKLELANARIAKARECDASVRADLAGEKKP